jgi:hypothetical protein
MEKEQPLCVNDKCRFNCYCKRYIEAPLEGQHYKLFTPEESKELGYFCHHFVNIIEEDEDTVKK